jgi:hypothetical protein
MHGLEDLDRDIFLIFEPEEVTMMSFLCPSPSHTTYNMSVADRSCSRRAAPLRAGSAVRSRAALAPASACRVAARGRGT